MFQNPSYFQEHELIHSKIVLELSGHLKGVTMLLSLKLELTLIYKIARMFKAKAIGLRDNKRFNFYNN